MAKEITNKIAAPKIPIKPKLIFKRINLKKVFI